MDVSQARGSTPDLYGDEKTRELAQSGSLPVQECMPDSVDSVNDRKSQSPGESPNHSLGGDHSVEATGTSGTSLQDSPTEAGPKRKRSHDDMSPQSGTLEAAFQHSAEPEKKRLKGERGPVDLAQYTTPVTTGKLHNLTVPIWQRILTFVPPASLARLLRVSRSFNVLLDAPVKGKVSRRSIDGHIVESTDCNKIWTSSHQVFARGLPAALEDQKDLDLWRLVKGAHCQKCGQRKLLSTDSGDTPPFQAGPGRNHTRVIWPFQARLCGDCLRSQIRTDDDLTLSGSFPSFLKDALPFVYLSESNDCVLPARYEALPPPPGLKLVKVYLRPQVEAIKRRYDHIKEFEPARAADWVESLDDERIRKTEDSERWEAWERRGTLAKLNLKSGPAKGKAQKSNGAPQIQPSPVVQTQPAIPQRQFQSPVHQSFPTPAWSHYQNPGVMTSYNPTPSNVVSPGTAHPRGQKTFAEIQAARAARRAEIERRCMLLQPPMPLNLLEHMESFRAALQISTTMDDASWKFLRARLETERAGAQEKLARQVIPEPLPLIDTSVATPAPFRPMSQAAPGTTHDLAANEPLPESPKGEIHISDVDVDPNASKLHKRLAHFADQVTLGKWNGGRSLSKESCPQFAAEVLMQVRKNYYDEAFGGHQAIDSSLPRVLLLENMRWVFDNRVKPLTEQFQKDVFLCNGCDNITKGYGLEAVIQHYAAKHTSSLSLGNVVVHWKAEWPEKPPFHPNPMLVKALAITSTTSTHIQQQQQKSSYEPGEPAVNGFRSNGLQPSSSPAGYYPGQMHASVGPFPTPGFNQAGYHGHEYSAPPLPTPIAGPSPGNAQYVGVVTPTLPAFPSNGTVQHMSGVAPFQPTNHVAGVSHAPPPPQDTTIPSANVYRKHLVEMAKLARELWFATAGVKGLPGTVRTQLIIHHACEKFVNSFQLQPGVAMFLDGLNHEAAMRPLRSLNGFSCKSCANGLPGALSPPERKQSTLPHLLGHFKSVHAEHHGLDWRKDMVLLPQPYIVSDLVNASGMDESKFTLLVSAFPESFPYPPPSLATLQKQSANNLANNQMISPSAYHSGASGSPVKASGYSGIIPPEIPTAQRASDSPGEDEYDPRRPSYIGRMVAGHQDGSHSHVGRKDKATRIRRAAGDADRFLDDLQPQVYTTRAEHEHHGYSAGPDIALGRYAPSHDQSLDNTTAVYKNGHANANEPRYYLEPEEASARYQETLPERYVTRYHEPVPRDVYSPNAATEYAYYIRQPDGRLVPVNDRETQIVYERDVPARERAYGDVPGPRSAGYYAPEPMPVSHHDGDIAYTYTSSSVAPQQASRVVYVDSRAPEQHDDVVTYDPHRPRDGYDREQIRAGHDAQHR